MTETTTLFGGTKLDTDEKLTQALAEGPEHAAECEGCHERYYRKNLTTKICWQCWYQASMLDAESAFRPLSLELQRLLPGWEAVVDQTGGMVMCLNLAKPEWATQGDGGRRVWFSSLGEFSCAGFGMYKNWDDEGEYKDNPDMPLPEPPAGNRIDWDGNPGYAVDVARWAAPLIREWGET